MDDLQLLIDLHKDGIRQGPGGDAQTRLAVALSGLEGRKDLKIADIGCGTGASTLVLADRLDAQISAVDFLPDFLAELKTRSAAAGLAGKITPIEASMDALPFSAGELDAIWSEGAIYNIGFEAGIAAWRRFLKPGGVLAVSELTWLTHERPADLQTHWAQEYAEVDVASAKFSLLERQGFSVVGYFALPEECWLDNYYRPMEQRFDAFLKANGRSDSVQAIIAAEQAEIELYEAHKAYVSYGYYIARKMGE